MSSIRDPRDRYDDLLAATRHERAGPAVFDELARSEIAVAGWFVLAFVIDRDDRLMVVDAPWDDHSILPSAIPVLSESHDDAVVRAVREDAGLDATAVRPHAVEEYVVENDATGETADWTTVFYEAAPADAIPALDPEPGVEVRWVVSLPDELHDAELASRVYERCVENGRS